MDAAIEDLHAGIARSQTRGDVQSAGPARQVRRADAPTLRACPVPLPAALSAARALLAALASGSGSEEATAQTAAQLQQTYLHSTGELRKKMLTLAERSSGKLDERSQQQPQTSACQVTHLQTLQGQAQGRTVLSSSQGYACATGLLSTCRVSCLVLWSLLCIAASRQAQQPDTGQTKDNDALIAELQQRKQQLIQQVWHAPMHTSAPHTRHVVHAAPGGAYDCILLRISGTTTPVHIRPVFWTANTPAANTLDSPAPRTSDVVRTRACLCSHVCVSLHVCARMRVCTPTSGRRCIRV